MANNMDIKTEFCREGYEKAAEMIKAAINKGSLSLKKENTRNWHGYKISITGLTWGRNLHDGYLIDVYKNDQHILSLEI